MEPEATLLLTVVDVRGRPVTEPVDVFLSNQTLSHNSRAHARSTPARIKSLYGFPNGRYQIEVSAPCYHTFRDMHEEREELVKQIFPQLRRLCESRAVTWGEVDLRWGVPDEAKAEGKVLPLCLAEIEQAVHI